MQVLIPANDIRRRIDAMASEIAAAYSPHEPVTIVGVLTGCLVFLADLIRRLDLPLKIELIRASSYRGTATTPSQLQLQSTGPLDLRDRHVLLIDDILDTGQTISKVVSHIRTLGAKSIRTAVLLRKLGRQQIPFEPDFCGFEIPDAFVVGYGLDFNDEYRHLPFVGILPG
jgi:hypoxanthine phosphoribosyltransferase